MFGRAFAGGAAYLFAFASSCAGAELEDPLGRFIQAETPASVARLSIQASALKGLSFISESQRARWDLLRPGNAASGSFKTLDVIFDEYRYRTARDDQDANSYGQARWLLKGTLMLGSTVIPGSGQMAGIAKGLASTGANAGIDSAVDELNKHGRASTSAWLEGALGDLVKGGRLPPNLGASKLATFSPEQRLQWLREENLVDKLSGLAKDVRSEDRPIVEGMIMRALNDRINRAIDIQTDRDRQQDAAFAKQVGAVSKTLNEFRKETVSELQSIRDQQINIKKQVDTLSKNTADNREDIDFLQRFMFERMNPGEQIKALRGGMFRDMPPAERAKTVTKIELIQARQKLIETVGDFGKGAATVAAIADKLGVNKNIVTAISNSAKIANATQTAMLGFIQGGMGYLSAADAISGLIFGSGPDPGEQRHQQVMQALGQIQEGIDDIKKMLVEMDKHLQEIKQLQLETLNALKAISDQIQQNHRETLAILSQIRTDLVPLLSINRESLFKEIERCAVFIKRLNDYGFSRDKAVSSRLPYSTLRSIDTTEEHGVICRKGLRAILSDPFGLEITYALNRFRGEPNSEVERYLTSIYIPTWKLLQSTVFNGGSLPFRAYVNSYTVPVINLRGVDAKRSALSDRRAPAQTNSFSQLDGGEISRRLETALSQQVIDRHARFLFFAHPFFEIAEALRDPKPDRLISMETTSVEGVELLRTTIALVETAIAQQVMLSGDLALNDLERIWRDGAPSKASGEADDSYARRARLWAELQSVLRANGALRHNLILQAVSRSVKERGNLVIYGVAYALPGDASYLETLLPSPQFHLTWRAPANGQAPGPNLREPEKSTGWHVKLGDEEYPLPTPTELTSGTLVQTTALRPLLDLRNELTAELEGYLTPERLSKSERTLLRQAIWRVTEHNSP
jgi:hypothetical protein